ncbi:MAG: methyltransferase domain-containing protein [Hyphomicrobiaceae bacterium]
MRQKLQNAHRHLSRFGVVPFARYAKIRYVVRPYHRRLNTPLPDMTPYDTAIRGKHGLEIGGPSYFFRADGQLPLYGRVGSMDNCNYATTTFWEGEIKTDEFTVEGRTLGRQFPAEATLIDSAAPNPPYEFIVSSNCIEHIANPLKAFRAMAAILAPGGSLIAVLPRKETNFDHRRKVTEFSHLLEDFGKDVPETDSTHRAEFAESFDISLAHFIPSREKFLEMIEDNIKTRYMHHHVFDLGLLRQCVAFAGLETIDARSAGTDYVILARKPEAG